MAALADVGPRDDSPRSSLNVLLKRIAEQARELLERHVRGAVFLPDAGGTTLPRDFRGGRHCRAGQADDRHPGPGHHRLDRRGRPAGDRQRRRTDTRAVHIAGTPEQEDQERLMVAPLLGRGGVNGVMVVWRTGRGSRPFTPTDLDFLVGLSQQAAIAIDNARALRRAARRDAPRPTPPTRPRARSWPR